MQTCICTNEKANAFNAARTLLPAPSVSAAPYGGAGCRTNGRQRTSVDLNNRPEDRVLEHDLRLVNSFAILNGTLAAAVGLGLRMWIFGLLIWLIGHAIAVWVNPADPAFLTVLPCHTQHNGTLTC